MSYDPRDVYGNNDALTRQWGASAAQAISIAPGSTSLFNVFGGNSFYLNSVLFTCLPSAFNSAGGTVVNLYNGPNAGNLTGAVLILQVAVELPTSAPAAPPYGSVIVLASFNGMNYHNATGAPGYLHINVSPAVMGSYVNGNLYGGATSIQT
jgi:hypothetical protein